MNYCLRYFSLLLALVLAGGGFSSCSDEPTDSPDKPAVPSFEVTLGTIEATSAELLLATTSITEYAWVHVPASDPQTLTPAAIFATGTTVQTTDGDSTLKISDLAPMTDYIVYLAAKTTAGEFFSGEIAPIEFTTIDYTDEITIVKRTQDGAVVRIRLPEEVVKRDNVVKWNIANPVMYNMNKMRGSADAAMLESNDDYYGKFFKVSTTLYLDDEHMVKTDENGEWVLDENGDPVVYWDAIVPGEPIYLLLGEHEWGESMFGWGEGWYTPMFDYDAYYEALGGGMGPLMSRADAVNEADFWSGYYKVVKTRAAEPALLTPKVKFEAALRPDGGLIQLTPEEGVLRYCVGIFDHATYEGQLLPMLDNNEDYLQWFTTSYAGAMLFNNGTYEGPSQFFLEEILYNPSPGVPYHILITAMGDEEGMTQNFLHEVIELPEPTLPAPNIEAKAIKNPSGTESPYEVWFNVKSPDASAKKVRYAANYLSEFMSALNGGASYADLISQSRGALSSEEVAQVNSSTGYNMMFPSREDATTRLAVMALNSEGTSSNPDAENSPAIADNRTIIQPAADRVESSLFQDLAGDWTATATVKVQRYNDQTWQNEWVDVADPIKSKVTIGAGITYPETLTSDVYDLYEGMSKAEVDALYAEFKEIATTFNSKVRGQNRLLCLGYDFNMDKDMAELSLKTPYDLFTTEYYSAPLVEDLFFDFGPKWYIQITKDNTAFVPVNVNNLAPMAAWATNDYHLAAASLTTVLYLPSEENMHNVEKWPNIPIEISADKNTVTLKKTVYEGENCYPSVVYINYGQSNLFGTKVSSEVTLTRGWDGPAPTKVNAHKVRNSAVPSMSSAMGTPVKSLGNGVLRLPEKPKSRTTLKTKPRVNYKTVTDFHVVTPEELKANMAKLAKRHNTQTNRK